MDGYDPLVIAALFYSERLRAAGDAVAVKLESATTDLRAASSLATSANSVLIADRAKLIKDIEAHVARCVKQATKGQSGAQGFRYIPVWYAIGRVFAIAAAAAIALMYGLERGSAQAEAAAVGRSFLQAVPSLDPKLRKQLIEHLQNQKG